MIYIGFSAPVGFDLFSKLIRYWQGGTKFSHSYIRYYDTRLMTWIILEASGEVHLIEWSNWLKKNNKIEEFAIEFSEDDLTKLLRNAVRHLEKPYSIKNIFGLAINRIFKRKVFKDSAQAFICSELVAHLFPERLQFDKALDYVEPIDVYNFLSEGAI